MSTRLYSKLLHRLLQKMSYRGAFHGICKGRDIHEFCQPNAILTFKENLMDYADEPLRKMGEEVILKALEEIEDEK